MFWPFGQGFFFSGKVGGETRKLTKTKHLPSKTSASDERFHSSSFCFTELSILLSVQN